MKVQEMEIKQETDSKIIRLNVFKKETLNLQVHQGRQCRREISSFLTIVIRVWT